VADTRVEIPDRDLFKASEVCEIASVQRYVLRSWELEFPNLGIARSPGSSRVYRRADVERVLRIKQLVFVEGLTLAGTRRRLNGDDDLSGAETSTAFAADETREKLAGIRQELRSLLDLLNGSGGSRAGHALALGEQPLFPGMDGARSPAVTTQPPTRSKRRSMERATE
jgi:DNA-binding transcriptional MerR regulator